MATDDVNESTVTYGSGNVFADLGLPHPGERLAKAGLASAIQDVIELRELTQAEAGKARSALLTCRLLTSCLFPRGGKASGWRSVGCWNFPTLSSCQEARRLTLLVG
jgi:hypothetical protein